MAVTVVAGAAAAELKLRRSCRLRAFKHPTPRPLVAVEWLQPLTSLAGRALLHQSPLCTLRLGVGLGVQRGEGVGAHLSTPPCCSPMLHAAAQNAFFQR